MNKPICTKKAPYVVEVEEGKTYYYCTCGKSEKQPFCDGAHKGTEFSAHAWTAEKTGNAYFCGCRASQKEPMCDGAHKDL